jgi:hypothetical protein
MIFENVVFLVKGSWGKQVLHNGSENPHVVSIVYFSSVNVFYYNVSYLLKGNLVNLEFLLIFLICQELVHCFYRGNQIAL